MNFYATRDYLDVIAEVYFKGRHASIEDVRIGSDVFRLLVVDGKHVVTSAQFLDYHEPLDTSEIGTITRETNYADFVARDIIAPDQWDQYRFKGFEAAPFIDWSMFPSYDDYATYLHGRNKRFARTHANRKRKLVDAFGELSFKMDDDQDDVLDLVRLWKKRQLRNSGEIDYYADPKTMEYLDLLRRRGRLLSTTLRAAGRLVSASLGFVHDGIWVCWVFAFDPKLANYSCGHHLLHEMFKESYRLGHRQFDFSIGGEDYKMIYATHIRLLGTIGQPPLPRRVGAWAKRELRERTPSMFQVVKHLKKVANRNKSIYQSWLHGTEERGRTVLPAAWSRFAQ